VNIFFGLEVSFFSEKFIIKKKERVGILKKNGLPHPNKNGHPEKKKKKKHYT